MEIISVLKNSFFTANWKVEVLDICTKLFLGYVYCLYFLPLLVYKVQIKHRGTQEQFKLNNVTNVAEIFLKPSFRDDIVVFHTTGL